jgi:hypothetical protein
MNDGDGVQKGEIGGITMLYHENHDKIWWVTPDTVTKRRCSRSGSELN